jgi:hypothetical protein
MMRQAEVSEEALPRLMLPESVALKKWTTDLNRRERVALEKLGAAETREPIRSAKRRTVSGGIPPKRVREMLGCTQAELDRWSSDGRFPPDGESHFHIHKSVWGRAWLPATVEAAKPQIATWRAQDATRKVFR